MRLFKAFFHRVNGLSDFPHFYYLLVFLSFCFLLYVYCASRLLPSGKRKCRKAP